MNGRNFSKPTQENMITKLNIHTSKIFILVFVVDSQLDTFDDAGKIRVKNAFRKDHLPKVVSL
jgi:hypothetical protein